jgi:hypothetical protein
MLGAGVAMLPDARSSWPGHGDAATTALSVSESEVTLETCQHIGAVWVCDVDPEVVTKLTASGERQSAYRDRLAAKAAADKKKADEAKRRAYETARAGAPTGGVVQARLAPLRNDEVRGILAIASVPSDWWPEFEAIAWCESRWRSDAIGDGGSSVGMWQVWRGWFAPAGIDGEAWADPVSNARVALHVRQVRGRFGGRGGWSCADYLGIE